MVKAIDYDNIHRAWRATIDTSGILLTVKNTYIKNGAEIDSGRTELMLHYPHGVVTVIDQTPDLPTVPIQAMKDAIRLYEETYGTDL